MPYFLVGDDAFALKTYLMKPWNKSALNHQEMIYNYRISRARRVVKNALGIMCARWRCLPGILQQGVEVVQQILECCVILQNLLRIRFPAIHRQDVDVEDANHNIIPGDWRQYVDQRAQNEGPGNRRVATLNGRQQRDYLQEYFNGVGAVDWQNDMLQLRN